ncbi:MAG: helix-turn-helix transcriptional regulator [Bacteroidota bacterium]
MIKNNLGRRIRMLRKSAGYTQEQLAEWSDYSVDFIGLVERGINAPSIEGCQKIADCLGVSMSELFDFSDIDAG